MTHDEPEPDAFESPRTFGERIDLGLAQAEPRHAAVDLERRGQRPVEAPAVGRPGVDLGKAVQDRRHPMHRAGGLGAGREPVQHEELGLRQPRADRERLVEVSDEELPAPLGCKARATAPRPLLVPV